MIKLIPVASTKQFLIQCGSAKVFIKVHYGNCLDYLSLVHLVLKLYADTFITTTIICDNKINVSTHNSFLYLSHHSKFFLCIQKDFQ